MTYSPIALALNKHMTLGRICLGGGHCCLLNI
jgi:hypothetical protein